MSFIVAIDRSYLRFDYLRINDTALRIEFKRASNVSWFSDISTFLSKLNLRQQEGAGACEINFIQIYSDFFVFGLS